MGIKDVSARKFMTITFTLTYCLIHVGNCILAIMSKIQIETYLALWGSFSVPMILIAEWYFKRGDRTNGGVK